MWPSETLQQQKTGTHSQHSAAYDIHHQHQHQRHQIDQKQRNKRRSNQSAASIGIREPQKRRVSTSLLETILQIDKRFQLPPPSASLLTAAAAVDVAGRGGGEGAATAAATHGVESVLLGWVNNFCPLSEFAPDEKVGKLQMRGTSNLLHGNMLSNNLFPTMKVLGLIVFGKFWSIIRCKMLLGNMWHGSQKPCAPIRNQSDSRAKSEICIYIKL